MGEEINEDFIQTRGSLAKKSPIKDFKVVEFTSYKPKKAKKHNAEEEKDKIVDKPKQFELNMKKAKFEIVKFGMSGFDPEKRQEAKVQLAIKLGAKPLKNKYKNYKELVEERKKELAKNKAITDFQQLGKNILGKSTAKGKSFDKKRKKAKLGLLDIYGTVKPSEAKKEITKQNQMRKK